MSFQAYLDTIARQTGKTPADLRRMAEAKGLATGGILHPDVKATVVTDWLKAELSLGHGHAMAAYALLKGTKTEGGG